MHKICSNQYEHLYWPSGELILGIDEAGRGPLAGPLSVAGVILVPGYENPEIYDSKAISEKKREQLYQEIVENALYYAIYEVTEEEIDRLNIYRADQKAMGIMAASLPADIVLTDAMPLPEVQKKVIFIIKGDQNSISIAAGSILAKVTRDHIMMEYDRIYPQYGFAKNKGYPTAQHMKAIEEYGITPIHRRSFGPVAVQQQKLDL